MKKKFKHAIAFALLVGFVVLALGSGSSPSSSGSSSSSSSSGCSRNYTCSKSAGPNGRHAVCGNNKCAVVFVWGTEEMSADCDCR